jgi:hypothetical protein
MIGCPGTVLDENPLEPQSLRRQLPEERLVLKFVDPRLLRMSVADVRCLEGYRSVERVGIESLYILAS